MHSALLAFQLADSWPNVKIAGLMDFFAAPAPALTVYNILLIFINDANMTIG